MIVMSIESEYSEYKEKERQRRNGHFWLEFVCAYSVIIACEKHKSSYSNLLLLTMKFCTAKNISLYLICDFSIFPFSAFNERLGLCLYKYGCVVKLSILMSTISKHQGKPN